MKIETADLIGPALNWAVTCLEHPDWDMERTWYVCPFDEYTEEWAAAGPIIERELIHLGGSISNHEPRWFALKVKGDKPGCYKGGGTTPLVAAMRCYVASRFGDEVDVPDYVLDKNYEPIEEN